MSASLACSPVVALSGIISPSIAISHASQMPFLICIILRTEPVKVLLVGVDHFDPSHSDALPHERSSPADECHLEELLLH